MSMSERDASTYELEVEVLVVGAGACGCTAALAAHGADAQVMVLGEGFDAVGKHCVVGGADSGRRKPLAGTGRHQ